jgi:hypothetical protein
MRWPRWYNKKNGYLESETFHLTQRHNSCAEFLHFSYNTLQQGEELLRFGSNMPFVFLLHSYMSNFRQNPFILEDD